MPAADFIGPTQAPAAQLRPRKTVRIDRSATSDFVDSKDVVLPRDELHVETVDCEFGSRRGRRSLRRAGHRAALSAR